MTPPSPGARPERGPTVVIRQRDGLTAAAGPPRPDADHSAEAIGSRWSEMNSGP